MTQAITRRQVLGLAGGQAGAVPTRAPRPHLTPREQLVNVLEFEEQAMKLLPPAAASLIADHRDRSGERVDRQDFDRITLRPRMCVPTLDLDLTVTLFGDALFAPIVVGPVADQTRFHPDGEIAMVEGVSAAKAPMILSSQSSGAWPTLVKTAATPVWAQVFASDAAARTQMQAAADAGCRAICLTVGTRPSPGSAAPAAATARIDWTAVGTLASSSRLPVVVKGVATVADAKAALQHNAKAIIVSNYGRSSARSNTLILQLPDIVDAVAGQVPVLADGGFRRGTDVVKALAFGAQAVVVSRPVVWGLAAYGVDGVRHVVEMLQTETARYMAMCGKSRVDLLTRDIVRVHRAMPVTASNDRL